jgi:hypothetical protein
MDRAMMYFHQFLSEGMTMSLAAHKAAARMQFGPKGYKSILEVYTQNNQAYNWTR